MRAKATPAGSATRSRRSRRTNPAASPKLPPARQHLLVNRRVLPPNKLSAGKSAYNSNCAVCHGSTMTNGTFAPPLAGEYFKTTWSGRSVRSFFDRAKSMPPASPASLAEDTYASIVAYVLEMNGIKASDVRLPSRAEALDRMTIK